MDNAQKAILIGVGLLLTIALISAVMVITGIGNDIFKQAGNQLGGLSEQMKTVILPNYDNKTLRGTEVLAAVKQYYNDDEVCFIVYNGSTVQGRGGANYIGFTNPPVLTGAQLEADTFSAFNTTNQLKTDLFAFSNNTTGNVSYIQPTTTYKAAIVKSSGTVVGMVFVK